ncbi:MAG: CPBP family intramembrane metalloprotease [Clostridiales bacterium]|nr:CPBP family intramembrane metalloprotease [Clostridiales bacterium]
MKKIWKAIGIVLALMAIYFLAQSIVTFIVSIATVLPTVMRGISSDTSMDIVQMTERLMRDVSAQTPLILLVSVAITVPFYYLIYHNRKQELFTFARFRGIGALSIPVLIIFSLAMNFLIEWLLTLTAQLESLTPFFERYEYLAQFITSGNFILSLLAVGVIGPVFEEILFRGLIFGEFRKITKVRAALFIQAVLFGIFHLNVIQGSYAFIIGLLLGSVYYRSNLFVAPIIVHVIINSSCVILSRLVTDGMFDKWADLIVAASAFLFVATGVFILLSRAFRRTMDNSLYEMNQQPEPPFPPTI